MKHLHSYDNARRSVQERRDRRGLHRAAQHPARRVDDPRRECRPARAVRETARDERAGLRDDDRSLRAQRRASHDGLSPALRALQSRSRGSGAQEAHRRGALLRCAVLDAGEGRQHPHESANSAAARNTTSASTARTRRATCSPTNPTQVWATTTNSGDRRFTEVPETVHVIMKFPEERIANFVCSFGAADTFALRNRRHERQRGRRPRLRLRRGVELRAHGSARRRRARNSRRATSSRPSSSISRSACATTAAPNLPGIEGLIDVAIIEGHPSLDRLGPLGIARCRARQAPPAILQQELRRPAVPREPKLVQVESGHG